MLSSSQLFIHISQDIFVYPKENLQQYCYLIFSVFSQLFCFSPCLSHSVNTLKEWGGGGLWQQFNMAKLINSWAWYAAQILAQALEQTRQRRQFRCQMTQKKRANNTQIGWEIWTKDRLEERGRKREKGGERAVQRSKRWSNKMARKCCSRKSFSITFLLASERDGARWIFENSAHCWIY